MSWNPSQRELKSRHAQLLNMLRTAERRKEHLKADKLRSRVVYIRTKYREAHGKEIDDD